MVQGFAPFVVIAPLKRVHLNLAGVKERKGGGRSLLS